MPYLWVCAAMDQQHEQGFSFDSEHFILSNQEEIEKKVNLKVLVPKLYKKQVVTKAEREALLYEPHLLSDRRTRLVDIVATKGKKGTRLFIECLREAGSHLPHSELATSLERSLQSGEYYTILNQSEPVPSNGSTAIDASVHSALPQSSHRQTPSNSQSPTHDPSTSAALGSSSYSHIPLALCNDHLALPRHASTSSVPSTTESLEQLQRSSPEFANLVLGISSELNHRGITFERIQQALLALLEGDAVPIQLPPHVKDLPALCLHLRHLNMCHEADTDLLCKLLETLELVDLRERVKSYADRVAATDVMQHRYQRSRPRHRHFVAFTFHSAPSLSLEQACEIKHFISDLLHIPRHTFTLVGSESGSIGLAWQIPVEYLKHVQSLLREDEEVRASLMSSKYQFVSIELEVKEGSERIVVFCEPISNTHLPASVCTNGQGSYGQCSISSQEDVVSSTMDDLSPSMDSARSHRKYCILYTCTVLCATSLLRPFFLLILELSKRNRSPTCDEEHLESGDIGPPPAKQPSLSQTKGM